MQSERWHKVDAILQAALALGPAERSTFLDRACGEDESLRAEVASLLSLEHETFDLIETPALESAAPLLATDQTYALEGQVGGRYRILSLLGEGGMGEVYLADDEKLNRKIALKLLPSGYAQDKDRLRRFQQEARAISALNHPNILTIHEIGEVEGRPFIATEFVEGETLRERLNRGRLKLTEVFSITVQVADALAAAHRVGIVHRDIKPENIMIRPDGYTKVLDFGLAKLFETDDGTYDHEVPDNAATSSDLLMGTVKYMSPEQASGANVDPRSDIFSLGVVLYEMLTGHLAFERESVSDLMSSILKEDPLPPSHLVPTLPRELDHIVGKALAKSPGDRYQTVDSLMAALAELGRELERDQSPDSLQRITSLVGLRRRANEVLPDVQPLPSNLTVTQKVAGLIRSRRLRVSLLLLTIAAVAGWILYGSLRRRSSPAFSEVRLSQLVESDKARFSAVSPDGVYVAYVVIDAATQSLVLKHRATNTNTVLVSPHGAALNGVTFSRDGSSVYFLMPGKDDQTFALHSISISGGELRKVLENVASPVTFSPDGRRFAFVRNLNKEESGLFVAKSDGSGVQLLGKRLSPSFFSPAGPSWSPDGRLIACAVFDQRDDKNPPYMNVVGVDVESGAERLLTNGKWSKILQTAWLSDASGFIMAATEENQAALLWHVSYPGGHVRRLTNDPGTYPSDHISVSLTADSRTLVASRFELRMNLWTASTRNPRETTQITFGGNHRFKRVAWTPDGKIVFPSDASGKREIWIMDQNGSGQKQLTFDGSFNQLPTVSPDGRYIVYVSGRSGKDNIWRMNVDGTNPVQLTHGEYEYGPHCSLDGRWVFYTAVASGKSTIWRVGIDGGAPIQLSNQTSTWPTLSPDGRRVACWWFPANSKGRIAVLPIEGGKIEKLLEPLPSASTILPLRWTSDGTSLVYGVTRNNISNFWRQPIKGGPAMQLTDFKSETFEGFDWSRDDRLLVSRGFTAREIVLIEDVSH